MNWMGWAASGFGLVVAAGIALAAFGSSHWDGATQAQMALLESARVPILAGRYDIREIDALPAPVQRYFRADSYLIVFSAKVARSRSMSTVFRSRFVWLGMTYNRFRSTREVVASLQ